MKRFILTAIAITLAFTALSQQGPRPPKERGHKENVKIEDFVSDLSKAQQKKIDLITSRSTKIIDSYKQQLHSTRDSIRMYMSSNDDRSDVLFPLYDREANLQSCISKEYYRTKVAIDKILTPEQQQQLHEKMKRAKKGQHQKRTTVPSKK